MKLIEQNRQAFCALMALFFFGVERLFHRCCDQFVNIAFTNHSEPRCRPYRVECTGSLLTSEVKRRRARLVLGWGTAWEHLRVLTAFARDRSTDHLPHTSESSGLLGAAAGVSRVYWEYDRTLHVPPKGPGLRLAYPGALGTAYLENAQGLGYCISWHIGESWRIPRQKAKSRVRRVSGMCRWFVAVFISKNNLVCHMPPRATFEFL